MTDTDLPGRISGIVSSLEATLIEYRRHLHQYPELGYQEIQTTAYIAKCLQRMGLQPQTGVGRTGVLVEFSGQSDRMVGYRADIDALPIQEKTGISYASKNDEVMHACGHDVHTAIALGVAHVLTELREILPGKIRLLFQPAEELMPGGAVDMIAAGAIDGLEAIYGLHVDPSLDVGQVGLKYGPHLASVDTFDLQIVGKMGHAAHPHLAIDPIPVAAQVISGLQTIPSRKTDPVKPVVLTIAMLHAGKAKNVIPESVQMSGTFRTLNKEIREEMPRFIEQIVAGICAANGATYRLEFQYGSPVLINDEKCMRIMEAACRKVLGDENVNILTRPRMGAEDFAHYLEHVPGAMMRLGTRGNKDTSHSLHSPFFHVDERALTFGVQLASYLLFSFLQAKKA